LNLALEEVKSFNEREHLFKLTITSYDEFNSIIKEFKPYNMLWSLASDFDMEKHSIMNGPFTKLSINYI
jgi:hypothetical protein